MESNSNSSSPPSSSSPSSSSEAVDVADLEAGFSGIQRPPPLLPLHDERRIRRPESYYYYYYSRSLVASPRSPRPLRSRVFCDGFDDDGGEGHHHFLDSCFLCKKSLSGNRDIFMYRGDTPFCSEECRQEQIEIDEAKEKKNTKQSLKEKQMAKANNSNNSSKMHARAGSLLVAS